LLTGKATVPERARQHNLTTGEIERWVDEGISGMENNFRARRRDIREQYERKLEEVQAALDENELELTAPARRGRELVKSVQAELAAEDHAVSLCKLCEWLGVKRRTYYYQPVRRKSLVDAAKATRIKAVIERLAT